MQIRTENDKICVEKTMEHKLLVKKLLQKMIAILSDRAENHDNCKLEDPEFNLFSNLLINLE